MKQPPVPVRQPGVALLNHALGESLGLDLRALGDEGAAAIFAGNALPEGSEPIAQAYAGHQFGHFTMLGDGRAILLGEQVTPDGVRMDVQMKGSGRTPFSRRGDGRAALGPMLREHVISEAMHALGIPTTRSLAVATTGQPVYRETALPGAVLTRVAASHIRVGTFEYALAHGDREGLKALADYTIERHYPGVIGADQPYLALLREAMDRQAALVARWLHVGFIHGVMNTDNMALSGETIDYGPCAFMDHYDPATVFSSIDRHGRYAFGNQPRIAQWNLARLAEALLPLLHDEMDRAVSLAESEIAGFGAMFERHWLGGMRRKLGLLDDAPSDPDLIQDLLDWMQQHQADYTNTFRDLASETLPEGEPYTDPGFLAWHARWQDRLAREGRPMESARDLMRSFNPAVIPRNHRVEEALAAASDHGDFSALHRLLDVLSRPYDDTPASADYRTAPKPGACAYQTFCGT